MLMTDLSVVSQGALSEEHINSIREVQQAFAMYSLSVRLPIAFMAELRFRQVHTILFAASPTCDSCIHHLNAASQPTQLSSNRLLQDSSNLLSHLISCNSCTIGKFARHIIVHNAQCRAGNSVWLQVHTAVQRGRPIQRPVALQRCCKQRRAATTSAAGRL